MENHGRSTELPDVIIQHIQSFLETREAAQTILVSKSWLRAWSTRPFLFFKTWFVKIKNSEHKTFYRYHEIPTDLIDRTLESYVEKGIPIVRFHLRVKTIHERWLKMARLSNVIELHLTAQGNWTDSLFQEIFLIRSLQVLSVVSHGFEILLLLSRSDIKCLNLKKLEFQNLQIDEVSFQHIMSSCPLIKELMLISCSLIHSPSYNNLGIQSFISAGECASLKRLSLVDTEINDEQLQTILSKSPQLEDLNIIGCSKLVKLINLSSGTLKSIKLDTSDMQLVLIDVPNLRKLKYRSCNFMTIPFPITIISPITKGTVEVTIEHRDRDIDESWFLRLREFLAKFAKSNVKFNLVNIHYPLLFDFKLLRATPLPPLNEVESSRIKGYNELPPLLCAFFTICHPKIVLIDHLPTLSKPEFLIELLKDVRCRGNLECCSFDQNKCWRHYIKDSKLYYVLDNEKKPLDIIGLRKGLENKEVITLALEWKSSY